ncbi:MULTISPECIES: hypothetical protein [Synechocystis]|uniref:Secreted protein n=1 Tax=Synechocystis salina LEGE 00031 TaxID=1828736 RepID=A0ABR9VR16_9SYNC|nr:MULTISPECIES: hypothetical protein [Synechocystis]MBD2655550.1 hypothetical protein [Synechocystis sp. FACHB-383]MBE9240567.1 hypothetical protein [Synechocystis salina LEGE 00041]MBE9253789.1 hypothetical protein [Synechocystis salina LEGE 00031]
MFKRFSKVSILLVTATALVMVCLQSLRANPALSEIPDLGSSNQSTLVSTAALPPDLVPAILGGRPVYVLYMTRAEDTVLIRCYPGYEPTIAVRAMGSNPNANTQKEGVMKCRPSA